MFVSSGFEEGEDDLGHELPRDDKVGNRDPVTFECNSQVKPACSLGYRFESYAEEALPPTAKLVGTSCEQIKAGCSGETAEEDEEGSQQPARVDECTGQCNHASPDDCICQIGNG